MPDSSLGKGSRIAYYIAKSEPLPNVDGVKLEKAPVGARFEDDYTKVRVYPDRIVYIVKD